MYRLSRLTPLLLLAILFGCGEGDGGGGGAPVISSFSANPATVAVGGSTTLSWAVTGNPTSLEISGIGAVSGTNVVVQPTTTTTYTLTATNGSGTASASTPVTVGGTLPGPGVEDGLPPSGSFGVSLSQTGPFQSDATGNITSGSDERVVTVAGGGTFYASVSYSDPGGIAGVSVRIANQTPAGLAADLTPGVPVGGFTLGAEVTGCVLDGTQTAVTCIYPITVAAGTQNISSLTPTEFAYVFRTNVTDVAGNRSDSPPRGYVVVGSGGGTPAPTPPGPTPPTPTPPGPTPTAPTINSFSANPTTINSSQTSTLTWSISGTVTGLSINNGVGDVSGTTTTVGPDSTTTYTLTARNGSATATRQVTVTVTGTTPQPGTFVLTVDKSGNGTGNVTSSPAGINCGTGTDCTESFPANAIVNLTAVPTSPSTFGGFSGGGCSGAGLTCQVTMNAAKTVQATFNTPTTSPELNAEAGSANKTGTVGQSVSLDGSASTGTSLEYDWSFDSTPTGNTASISGVTAEDASFTPNVSGNYVVRLIVTSGTAQDFDIQTINVSPAASAAPDANAGADRTVDVSDSGVARLDGSASQNAASYAWQITTLPTNGTMTITNATDPVATFAPTVPGRYVATLTVRDGSGTRPDTDTVTITANP